MHVSIAIKETFFPNLKLLNCEPINCTDSVFLTENTRFVVKRKKERRKNYFTKVYMPYFQVWHKMLAFVTFLTEGAIF